MSTVDQVTSANTENHDIRGTFEGIFLCLEVLSSLTKDHLDARA